MESTTSSPKRKSIGVESAAWTSPPSGDDEVMSCNLSRENEGDDVNVFEEKRRVRIVEVGDVVGGGEGVRRSGATGSAGNGVKVDVLGRGVVTSWM